jgi:[ribosomal protein S5]-alanine N-acetyltransferase
LANTPLWLRFIGDKNLKNSQDAEKYIQEIIKNAEKAYYIIKLKANGTPIGLITFIQRTYLAKRDIGFALLPDFFGKGYAEEALKTALNTLQGGESILAICLPDNNRSIHLLEKVGFFKIGEVKPENELLSMYSYEQDFAK